MHNHLLGSVDTAGVEVIKCYALSRFLSVGGWGGYRNVNFKLTMIVSPPHDVGNLDTKTYRISHKGRVAAPNWMNFRENPNGLRPPPHFRKIMLQTLYDRYGCIYARRYDGWVKSSRHFVFISARQYASSMSEVLGMASVSVRIGSPTGNRTRAFHVKGGDLHY